MTAPVVSVLIPTYNYARYLPEAIDSVLEQDFRDFELLLSDDGSTDNSAEIIRRYAAQDRRIRFNLHPRNLGMVQNWNWCLSEARGEYVKFLFGDDRMACPEALSHLVGLLEARPSAVLATSPRLLIDENSNVIKILDAWGKPGLHLGTKVIAQCLIRNGNLIGEPSAVLFRKRDATRGFNIGYRQHVDTEMWFHLLETGDLVCAAKPLCCFRQHRLQQTEINRIDQIGEKEGFQLLTDYQSRPYLGAAEVRNSLAANLYYLRKSRRKNAAQPSEVLLEMERSLIARLGGWHWVYWVRRRIVRPFENLQRWFRRAGKRETSR
jgi:glycosyltransferase involved in cell wall biosynthesis